MTDEELMILRLPQSHPDYVTLMDRVFAHADLLRDAEYEAAVNALIPTAEQRTNVLVGSDAPRHVWGKTFLAEMMRLCREQGLRR